MTSGFRYSLLVTGCMRDEPDVCGRVTAQIALADEPLQAEISGGDRTVGEDTTTLIDACASQDPDDPAVPLRFSWTRS